MKLEKILQKNFSKKNKIIPSRFHYDLQGSRYFEKITKTKEYYVTRIEKEILKKITNEINLIFGRSVRSVFKVISIEKFISFPIYQATFSVSSKFICVINFIEKCTI